MQAGAACCRPWAALSDAACTGTAAPSALTSPCAPLSLGSAPPCGAMPLSAPAQSSGVRTGPDPAAQPAAHRLVPAEVPEPGGSVSAALCCPVKRPAQAMTKRSELARHTQPAAQQCSACRPDWATQELRSSCVRRVACTAQHPQASTRHQSLVHAEHRTGSSCAFPAC